MKKVVIIFSGSNDRAVITLCRYAKEVNLAIYIVANGELDPIYKTAYAKHVRAERKKNVLEITQVIGFAKSAMHLMRKDEAFILPTTEFLNRFLLENALELGEQHIEFGLCPKHIYYSISDKYSFGILCKNYGLTIPNELNGKPGNFPFVIKPKSYGVDLHKTHFKPAVIYDEIEYEEFIKGKNIDQFYYQEYIEGRSYYLLYYFNQNGDYTVYSQENYIQQHNGGSMILCASSNLHHDQIAKRYATFFKELDFTGLVMIELKYFQGQFYIIEANPRFWGPSQLIIDAGMNLFDKFFLENKLIDAQYISLRHYNEGIFYYWSGGLVDTLQLGNEPVFYQYDQNCFIQDYNRCLASEIYLKEDTLNIYLKENT
jgi:predicted ATP-grasp superfamily ATP-dependent carboligase